MGSVGLDTSEIFFQGRPSLESPTSQACTGSQFEEGHYRRICELISQTPRLHRKQWEYVYIIRALERLGFLREGVSALGFGCGKEPLPAFFAGVGLNVTVTDIPFFEGADSHWGASDVEQYFYEGICALEKFRSNVEFRFADMNDIPADFHGFDVVWSCCSLEHLGSLKAGLDFIKNSMECLKPGGVSIHTTEFNVSDDIDTFESSDLSLYRRLDIARLSAELLEQGHEISPLNFFAGDQDIDRYVDLPPYRQEVHLKLKIDEFVVTSFGLIIRRPNL